MVKTACQAMCTCNSALDVSQLDMQDEQQLERMEEAVGVLLRCIGEDPSREGLIDTPRVSKSSINKCMHCVHLLQTYHSCRECLRRGWI